MAVYHNKRFFRIEAQNDNLYKPTNYGVNYDASKEYNGYIKCKLVHKKGESIILPELIIIGEKQFNWIQHFTFLMNLLVKDGTEVVCSLMIDLAFGTTINIKFFNYDLIKVYQDNSSLFKCKIYGPEDLEEYFTGNGYFDDSMVPFLRLFHHTKDEFKEIIEITKILKSSKWNFQGTKELTNINFIYFTCLEKVDRPADLRQIAMSSDGEIFLIKDDYNVPSIIPDNFAEIYDDGVVEIKVYRESTLNRKATIEFYINSTNLFTPNLWLHKPANGAVYYEICNPYIYRIGIENNGFISFENHTISTNKLPIQSYLVIGDCTSLIGLEAPYDEEFTSEIFKIEPLLSKINILDFWFTNSNKDLYSGIMIQALKFKKNAP